MPTKLKQKATNQNNVRVRKVADSVLKMWGERFEPGDVGLMMAAGIASEKIIRFSLKHGQATERIENAITKFFKAKK